MRETSVTSAALTPLDPAVLDAARAQTGASLLELSRRQPQLLVFLRHPG
jgi:hypothetical protein